MHPIVATHWKGGPGLSVLSFLGALARLILLSLQWFGAVVIGTSLTWMSLNFFALETQFSIEARASARVREPSGFCLASIKRRSS